MEDHKKHGRLPPSPFPTLPIIGHLPLFKQPLHRKLAEVADKNGPILFLKLGTRNAIHVSSASGAEECLTKRDEVFANRPQFIGGQYFGNNYTSMFWAPYGDLWRNLKPVLSKETHSLAGDLADEAKSLLARIHHQVLAKSTGEQALDVQSLIFETVQNVLTRMLVGKRYYGETTVETEEAKKFKQMVNDIEAIKGLITIGDFFPAVRFLAGCKEKEFKFVMDRFDKYFQDRIDERKQSELDSGSFVDILLLHQKKDPQVFTDEVIIGQLNVLWFVGHNTNRSATEWTLSLLLNEPEILKKAQAEINEVVGDKRLIQEKDLKHLPYFQCIINETLRMYPASPMFLHRSSKDTTVGGYDVPSNTLLFLNVWSIQNDPTLWEEPRKFKPQRFEGVDLHKLGFKYMPFGVGLRACPRENDATKFVSLVIGSLLQCFEWERTGKEEVDMEEIFYGLAIIRANTLMAKCKPRPHTIKLFDA